MKEFKINKYITLKLVDSQTIIYLDNNEFLICKSLQIQIPKDKINSFNSVESMDEIIGIKNENSVSNISPEVEFWGHCSNLQAWVENDYNTRLLHSNVAFPLLEQLSKKGDPLAKKVFKEEIIKKINGDYTPTIIYLVMNRYLIYLTDEELNTLIDKFQNQEKTYDKDLLDLIYKFDEERYLLNSREIIFLAEHPKINLFELIIKHGKKYFKKDGEFAHWGSIFLRKLSEERPKYLERKIMNVLTIRHKMVLIEIESKRFYQIRPDFSQIDDFSIQLYHILRNLSEKPWEFEFYSNKKEYYNLLEKIKTNKKYK